MIQLSSSLDPGIFQRNREQKIKKYQEKKEDEKKSTILSTLNSLGESYMDAVKFIQNHLSLSYHLTKKQSDFQYLKPGLNQNLYNNEMLSHFDQFKPRHEHQTNKFMIKTQEHLNKEREKNKYFGREIDHKARILSNPTIKTIDDEDDLQEQDQSDHHRLLQSGIPQEGDLIKLRVRDLCQNNSFMVIIQQSTYFCNGVLVSESDYLKKSDDEKKNCKIIQLKYEACLCPLDYTGKRCELESRVFCEVEFIDKPQCPEYYSFKYVSQYSGLPPCVTVSSKDILKYELRATCQNAIPINLQPTVYGANSDYKILFDERPPSAGPYWKRFEGFKYYLQSQYLVLSRARKMIPQIQYINWNNLGYNIKDAYYYKLQLSQSQVTGNETFHISFNFRNLDQNMTTAGRYTIEFNLVEQFTYSSSARNPYVMSASGVKMLVFELSDYEEPNSDTLNTGLIVIIVVLSIASFLGISFAIFCLYRQRVNKRKRSVSSALDDNSLQQNLNDNEQNPQRLQEIDQQYQIQEPQQEQDDYNQY